MIGSNLSYPGLGHVDVFLQDQTSALVDRFLTRELGTVTLAQPVAFGAREVTLEPGHGFTNPPATILPNTLTEMLEIDYLGRQYQARVRSVVGDVIGVSTPFCMSVPAGVSGRRTSPDGNVDGSVTPVVMSTSPPEGVVWDVNILAVNILDQTEMDDAKFGGLPILSNGVVYRTVNTTSAENIFVAVDNSCYIRHCDVENPYSDRAPAGYFGFNAKRRFNGQTGDGVARRIGEEYHSFQAVIYSNLEGLDRFWNVVRGHIVEE